MLGKKAIYYYKNGYNCSQCILKACEQEYGIVVSKNMLKMCTVVNNGFGIGNMCSVLIASIMVFGILFDESTAKELRLRLLNEFHDTHSSFNCSAIGKGSCENIIIQIADITQRLIQSKLNP